MIIRKCSECGREMEQVTTKAKTGWKDYEVIVKGVKAYKCPACGELVYDYETTHMLQEIGKSLSELNEDKQPNILNVEEVADLLRVSRQTIYNMIKDGRLEAFKAGREWRFDRKDIESIINGDDLMAAARGENVSKKDIKILQQELKEM